MKTLTLSGLNNIINEYNYYINKNLLKKFKNLQYEIRIINENRVNNKNNNNKNDNCISKKKYKVNIKFLYNNILNTCVIYYNNNYPYHAPTKIILNNVNIVDIYNDILIKNHLLFYNNDIYTKSLLHNFNWGISKSIKDILNELCSLLEYQNLYIKRKLLDKICNKYTNQYLDFLHYYLL